MAQSDMNTKRLALFPVLEPFDSGLLALDHGHQMHWQASGNPDGKPVLWIHGGPGSSASPLHRRLFDPTRFLIIQYDQRGCGRSEPHGDTAANTTSDLLQDIEHLRHALGIVRWDVAGGSWGATLALLYVQAHPDAVDRVLLRSTFLGTGAEIDAFLHEPQGACEAPWLQLRDACSNHGVGSILDISHRVFCEQSDNAAQCQLARAWVQYESAMDAYPAVAPSLSRFDDSALIARYQVHTHYLQHRCFLKQAVLSNTEVMRGLDLTLVHGEADALCPFANSVMIQRSVPHATLVPVAGAGHNMFDNRMLEALLMQFQTWT